MSYAYVVRPRADRDLEEIAEYLADEAGLDIALRFQWEFYDTLSMLCDHPRAGWRCKVRRPEFAAVRVFRINGYFDKILIFYRVESGHIDVIRVLHGSRDLEAVFARSPID